MESLTRPSTVTSHSSLQQPKIEIDLSSQQDSLNLVPFHQLETELVDSMEISEQQLPRGHNPEGTSRTTSILVTSLPLDGTLGGSSNANSAPSQNHAYRLQKYVREHGKIPVIFREKDGHPYGQYASEFKTELNIAVKNLVSLNIKGWKCVSNEQKQHIFDRLESLFVVDFGQGPNSVKKQTEKYMNVRFRHYRRRMHEHYKSLANLPWEERLKCVPTEYCQKEADWEYVCKMFESESYKKMSAVNSANAKGNRRLVRCSNDTDTGCLPESALTSNIVSDNPEDVTQSLEDDNQQFQESRGRLRNGLEQAQSTSNGDPFIKLTISKLTTELASTQNELHSTRIALQLAEDKVRMLEENQKRLEANQDIMKHLFERIAFGITQSLTQLPSSSMPPPEV